MTTNTDAIAATAPHGNGLLVLIADGASARCCNGRITYFVVNQGGRTMCLECAEKARGSR